jgi:hypothetical protein
MAIPFLKICGLSGGGTPKIKKIFAGERLPDNERQDDHLEKILARIPDFEKTPVLHRRSGRM